mgnify:CR=1 FL=1
MLSTTAWVAVQDAGNTALLIALAATLPRQIDMTLDMHQLTAGLTDMIAVWTRIKGACEHIEPVADAGFADRIGFGRLELRDGMQKRDGLRDRKRQREIRKCAKGLAERSAPEGLSLCSLPLRKI